MRRIVTVLVVALAAVASLDGCKKDASTTAEPAGGRGGKRGAGGAGLSFAVDVLPVEAKKVDYIVQAPGTVEAFERVQVTARVAGAVDRVAFTEGQAVKKGDVMVVIDSERFALAVNSAKAAVAKAQASQKDMEAMVTRRESASDASPGLIPGEELASYRTKSLTAKADTDVAMGAQRSAELNMRDAFVRAPMEGIVQTRTIETGQYVQAGFVVATLLRVDPMLLRFSAEPGDAARLKPGMMAQFTLRETLRTYTAKISLVSGSADPATHMVPVTAEVQDDAHKFWLRPGSFCDVSIDLASQRDAPLIPRVATRASERGYIAYVIEGDVAKERILTLGMNTKDGWVEVRNGLTAGETLVVRGGEALTDGAKVRASKVDPKTLFSDPDAGPPERAAREGRDGGGGASPAGTGTGGRRGGRGAGGASAAPSATGAP